MFQHKYYALMVVAVHVGILGLVGWAAGDLWGVVLLNWHITFNH